METSILIAKIIAIAYLSIGVGLLFSGDYYKKELVKMLGDSSYMLFGGLISIIIGMLIIEYHNNWVKNWTVLITIIGWIAVAKGIFLLAFPKSFCFFKPMLKPKNINKFMLPLVIIMGLIFAYFGFFA